jgi:hypothetical protein
MAYRGRRRTVQGVDLVGVAPLDAVPLLVPAWARPPWADAWEDQWARGVSGERVRACVVVPVRGSRTAAPASTSGT